MINKKTIIDFFKPDLAKIIIFLLLFIFLPVMIPCITNFCPKPGVCDEGIDCEPKLFSSPGTIYSALMAEFGKEPSSWYNPNMWPMWYNEYVIYHLFVTFVLSCIIIFGYNIFRSKK